MKIHIDGFANLSHRHDPLTFQFSSMHGELVIGEARILVFPATDCKALFLFREQGGDGPKAQRADVLPSLMASEFTFHVRNQLKIHNLLILGR